MTTFYRLKENGTILDYTEIEIATETTTQTITEIEYKEVVTQMEVAEHQEVVNEYGEVELKEVTVLKDVTETIEVPVEKEIEVTIDHVPAFIREQYIETDRKIIRLTNGTLAFEDEVDQDAEALAKLEKAKKEKGAEMKAERDRLQETPLQYGEKWFDYNKESLQKLNEARDDLAGTDDKQVWICADNSLTFLTYADIMGIKKVGKVRSNDLHMQYLKLKLLIAQKATVEEVAAVTFDTDTSEIDISFMLPQEEVAET